MRALGFVLAVFWSFQGAICFGPWHADATHASGSNGHSHFAATHPAEHHPEPQEPDEGSSDHCSSLGQTISASPPVLSTPEMVWLAFGPIVSLSPLLLARIGPGDHELAHPPPDLVLRNVSFRI